MLQYVAVAGANGYTGRRIIEQLLNHPRWRARALVRSQTAASKLPVAQQDCVICALTDVSDLTAALRDCAAVIQTIGTTRAQFAPGISYETVDYATTLSLLAAAEAAGTRRFLLLSSVG